MKKVLIFIIFTLFLTNSSYSEKINTHGGALELPESARPNDATISHFELRKKLFIEQRRREGRLYTVTPKGNAKKFTYEKFDQDIIMINKSFFLNCFESKF